MKRTCEVLSGLVILLLFGFLGDPARASDPPHNSPSSITCAGCHGRTLAITGGSPFWTDNRVATAYNAVCLRCHVTEPGAVGVNGYLGNSAPVVKSHAPGGSVIRCTVCHQNHDQEQIYPGKYAPSNFFIATATGDTVDPYDELSGTTTINCSDFVGKGDWVGAGRANLAAKTIAHRGAMLVPDRTSSSRWPIYMISAVDPDNSTITVRGELSSAPNIGIFYGQQMRGLMEVNGEIKIIEFYDRKGSRSFTNDSGTGICQVCHENQGKSTGIQYWRNDGTGNAHNTGSDCMDCHLHAKGINHNGAGDCSTCHSEHHSSSSASAGQCEYCHADPRPSVSFWEAFLPGDNGINSATYVPTQMACIECHVSFSGGEMTVTRFTRSDYSHYKIPYAEETAHTIANAGLAGQGRINNYGICLSCHNGSIATAVKVWHARPDIAGSGKPGAWVFGVSDDRRCTGTAGNESADPPPNPDSWALNAPGRSSGTIGSFNLFRDPGFGYTPNPSWADPCSDRDTYSTPATTASFMRIAIPAVPGNGNTSGPVPVFASQCPMTPGGEECPPVLPAPDETFTFSYTGVAQTLYIPENAINIQITVKGGGGGGGRPSSEGLETAGQPGGKVVLLYGNSGVILTIYVGKGGSMGSLTTTGAPGGWGYPSSGSQGADGQDNGEDWAYGGAGGGGASSVYLGGTKLAEAKGGNGGKSDDWFGFEYMVGGNGGAGGGSNYYTTGTQDVSGGGAGGTTVPTDGEDGQIAISYNYK